VWYPYLPFQLNKACKVTIRGIVRPSDATV
jgi:hypothetical protein